MFMSGQVPRTPEDKEDQKTYAELKPCSLQYLEDEQDEETAEEGDRFSQIIPPYQEPMSHILQPVSRIHGCCFVRIEPLIKVCFSC